VSIGQNLKETRLKRGKTLEEVAEYLETSPQTIYKYENGIIKNIPINNIEKICEFLDVHPATIMNWQVDEHSLSLILSVSEQLMLEEYRKLSGLSQDAIDQLIHALVTIEEEQRKPGYVDIRKL
jgi:transcriptional regulator with XRE-family HTH domain